MTTQAQAEYDARRALERQRGKKRTPRETTDVAPSLAGAKAAKVKGHPCRLCELDVYPLSREWGGYIEAHHIVPRSRMGRSDEMHDHANLMPLCHVHHQDHHTTDRRVPRSVLLPSELQFAIEHAGNAWVEKWYPDTTERTA